MIAKIIISIKVIRIDVFLSNFSFMIYLILPCYQSVISTISISVCHGSSKLYNPNSQAPFSYDFVETLLAMSFTFQYFSFSLFGKVFLLYINSFLYVFHHFYSFFHNGELVLLNDYTQFVKLKFLKGYFTWMVRQPWILLILHFFIKHPIFN